MFMVSPLMGRTVFLFDFKDVYDVLQSRSYHTLVRDW